MSSLRGIRAGPEAGLASATRCMMSLLRVAVTCSAWGSLPVTLLANSHSPFGRHVVRLDPVTPLDPQPPSSAALSHHRHNDAATSLLIFVEIKVSYYY